MLQRRPPSSSRGFTLVEAIATIVLLAVAIPSMFWSLRDAQVKRSDPALACRARWVASEKLEAIIADRQSESRGYSYITSGNYPSESTVSLYPGFSRSVSISETRADLTTAGTGYKRVTVTTTYASFTGQTKSLSISTILTDF